jgi:hypothetical protein
MFVDALALAAGYLAKATGNESSDELDRRVQACTSAAGGERYIQFFQVLVGE